MNVLIIGNTEDVNRFKQRFPNHTCQLFNEESNTDTADLLVLFDTDNVAASEQIFNVSTPILIECSHHSLTAFLKEKTPQNLFIGGFCSLPTFFEREVFELSVFKQSTMADQLFTELSCEFEEVTDQVGLVTPRVIAMIINEAYYTLEDGTATKEDIDTAMKLGTNYPYGPFEWCELIGTKNLYQLLREVFKQTGDIRYRPCDLLKKESEII